MRKLMMALALCAVAQAVVAEVKLPTDKSKFKIVVLAGQSNMCGRGTVDPANNKPHPRVVMLNQKGEWVPCVDPIHFDVENSGVGPGKTFAEALAESDPSITVGVVPTAIGGSSLAVWEPGKSCLKGKTNWHPYDDCVARTKKATERGTLAAILWHQGESDCMRRGGYLYQVRFPLLVSRLRQDAGAEGVPLIVGGLHPKNNGGWFGDILKSAQTATCEYLYGPGQYVPGKEWPLQPDNIHYTREAQQEFGKMYFAAYQDVMKNLASNKDFYKDRPLPKNLQVAANKVVPAELMDQVPATLPEIIEKYAFPNGRPAAKK
jgi:hypothetical protein